MKISHALYPSFRRVLSPRGLALRGFGLVVMFVIAHVLGLRGMAAVLCGMMPTTGAMASIQAMLGLTYILLYLGAVVLAPVLLMAALLLAVWRRHAGDGDK